MHRVPLALLVALLLLPAAARADVTLPAGFSASTPWSHLDDPTAIRFAPDGHVYVIGKGGIVYAFDGLDDPTPSIYADLRTKVHHGWDRGLLGLAVDAQSRVYVAYTYDKDPNASGFPAWNDGCPDPPGFLTDGCTVMGRLSRLDPDGTEHVLIEDFCDQFPSHSIGTLEFGPDHMLYMGAGDGAHYDEADYGQSGDPPDPCAGPPFVAKTPPTGRGGALRAQSFGSTDPQIDSLDGTIMRLNPETGDAALGNPAYGSPDPRRRRIIAYGLRNPFRFTFRPGTKEIWAGDVGWAAWEEIDRIPDATTVRNYGWPCWEGTFHQDSYDALNLDACTSLYGEGGTVAPYYAMRHSEHVVPNDDCRVGTSSLSGIAFGAGDMFPPSYKDALFFTDYSRVCTWVMLAGPNGLPDPSKLQVFATGTFAVDLQFGPDGALYYPDIAEGAIERVAYDEPVATIAATNEGRTFHFQGSGGVSYAWDFGDGGASTERNPSHTYAHDGPFTVHLRVTDSRDATGTASKEIQVGTPPPVRIDAPTPGTTWSVGDTIAFSGAGQSLEWGLDIHHCSRIDPSACHVHHVQDFFGPRGSFAAPDHEYPSYLELTATATDGNGLTSTTSVRLDPKTAGVTMASSPPGLRLSFASEAASAPFSRTVISCSETTVTAPSPQSLGAATYLFGGWGDGFAQTREVRAPYSGNVIYTASFAAGADQLLAGTASVGDNWSTALPGGGEAYRTTATVSGPALALRLYLDETSKASSLIMGLYAEADGDASALLGTGTLGSPQAGGWNEVRLAAPVPLVAGRRYWIALLNPAGSGGNLVWRDRVGAPDSERTSQSRDLTALPAVWATKDLYIDGGPASASAVGRPSAPPLGGAVNAPACVKPEPTATPFPTVPATPTPTPTPKPKPAKLPRLTVPSRVTARAGKLAIRVVCPPVASCRFTVRAGGRSATRTVARGRSATIRLKAPKARRAQLTITRRTDGRTDTAKRYALISAPSSRATRAA